MASDIAGFAEELQAIKGLRVSLLVTGLPNKNVLSTLSEACIARSDLRRPTRIASQRKNRCCVPRLSVLQKRCCIDILVAAILVGGIVYCLRVESETAKELFTPIAICLLWGIANEAIVLTLFLYHYLSIKFNDHGMFMGERKKPRRLFSPTHGGSSATDKGEQKLTINEKPKLLDAPSTATSESPDEVEKTAVFDRRGGLSDRKSHRPKLK
ncbi:hypothetical protein BDQ17DRAFT_1431477 [Cyathus striatus]|nr:hypothetical protein BDQ17DRAFT_1431477 [Cyathus striatus]